MEDREFLRDRLETFNTEQEVCDLLQISVPELLERFEDKLDEYVNRETAYGVRHCASLD